MRRTYKLLLTLLFGLSCNASAWAQFDVQTVYDFMTAQTKVYKTGTDESVEEFVGYMSEDIKDVHVAYGREFSGKDHFRKNMPKKSKALMAYEKNVSQVIMGSNVAVVIFNEQTKEKKPDGRINNYNGRTIMVLDFNDEGLITQMTRYQD